MSEMCWLECNCCGRSVLGRVEPCWYEDESEKCECGCTVTVGVDESGGASSEGPVAYVIASEDCPEGEPAAADPEVKP